MTLPRLPVVRFSVAVGASLIALGVEALAQPFVDGVPYFFQLLAVVFTTLVAGRGPGLLAMALTAGGTHLLTLFGAHGPLSSPRDVAGVVLFAVTGSAVVLLASRAQRARAQAEENAAELASVFSSISDGFVGLDRELRFTFANGAAERLLGSADLPLQGLDAAGVLGAEAAASLRLALRTGTACTLRVVTPAELHLEMRAHPTPDGLALYVTDRSERERVERAATFLAEAGEILGSSLEYEATLQRVARLAVPRFADFCRVDVMDAEGLLRGVAVAHVDPDKERALQALEPRADRWGEARRVFSGQTLLVEDMRNSFFFEDGAVGRAERQLLELAAPRSAILAPLRVHGQVLGAVSFCHAESGRRYGAADVFLAEEIARRAAMAIDNARLYREAREAVQLRDEFLSVASHELKTPLTSMRMQVQLLARAQGRSGEAGLPPAEIRTRVDAIERQLTRLARLIDRLLDVTRIAAGRLHIEPEQADLAELAREVAERFAAPAHIAVSADGPVAGWVDRFRLEQVLTNLLDNAVKYGNGQPIEVRVARQGERAVIAVRDRGIGIPAAAQNRLFQRFERLENARTASGLGLGLYIAQQIVQAHGGAISLESVEGAGTTFRVELPAAA